jgi:AhpD family alkylhydroperoxidase
VVQQSNETNWIQSSQTKARSKGEYSVRTAKKTSPAHSRRKKASEQADAFTGKIVLEPKLQEIVRLRVAQICNCQLGIEVHTEALKAQGESNERIQQLKSWRESLLYDERERAALAVSEALGSDPPQSVSKDIVHKARSHFKDGEIIQLALTIFAVTDWNYLYAF